MSPEKSPKAPKAKKPLDPVPAAMLRVYKYRLALRDKQQVQLPAGAASLSVQEQNGELCLWALVDPAEKKTETRTFRVHGTGHDINAADLVGYIGTVQQSALSLVWHVFEVVS